MTLMTHFGLGRQLIRLLAVLCFYSPLCLAAEEQESLRFSYVTADQVPTRGGFDELVQFLSTNDQAWNELARRGVIKPVINAKHRDQEQTIIEQINQVIDQVSILRNVDRPKIRVDIEYLKINGEAAKMHESIFVRPTREEVVGGLTSKAYPFFTSAAQHAYAYGQDHWVLCGTAICLSFTLDVFHGAFVRTWLNFQDLLERTVGTKVQMLFNFFYGQMWGVVFRSISYAAGASKAGPFTQDYLSVSMGTAVGAQIFGTPGYQGLNQLNRQGEYSRNKTSLIQQWVRDMVFMIEQTQLYIGSDTNMNIFWALWTFNQISSSYFYLKSQLTLHRPVVFVASDEVAASKEFKNAFPNAVSIGPIERTPLRQKWDQLVDKFKSIACGSVFGG